MLSDAGASGEGNKKCQALCGGCLTAPAPAPVRGGVLRKRGLGLLAATHSSCTNNPQLMHRILMHRPGPCACSAQGATQAGAAFAWGCGRGACLAVVVLLRPRRLERWGGLKVRPPKRCGSVAGAKNYDGWMTILCFCFFFHPLQGGGTSIQGGGEPISFYKGFASAKKRSNTAPTCVTVSGSGIK